MNNIKATNIGPGNLLELLFLAALWGGSFLLLRITAPVFGPLFLIEMRVLTGLLILLPILLLSGKFREFSDRWPLIALFSFTNMCLPFCLLAFASLTLGAGMISILNATVPFFAAAFGFVFFKESLTVSATTGLIVGFAGVVVLMTGDTGVAAMAGSLIAFAAGLLAAGLYGFSANLVNQHFLGVSGLAITTGCLFFTTLYLSPLLIFAPPSVMPGVGMWINVFFLGTFCTGLAYILFYRLIARIGAYQTLSVTYLIPMFSIFYGVSLLGETVSLIMLLGSVLVLLGVAVTTGRLKLFPLV